MSTHRKLSIIQEANQRLEKRLINEQANQRVQPLVDFLKKNSYTAAEIQQALATLKIALPTSNTQQKTTTQPTQQTTQPQSGYGYINSNLNY